MKLVKTVKIRIKDSRHIRHLKQMSRAVNFVWNYCNETSLKAIRYDSKFLTGYQLTNLTSGTSKDLGLSSSTIQEICQEFAAKRAKARKTKLRWRGQRSLGWVPFAKSAITFKDGAAVYLKNRFEVFQPERVPSNGTYGAGEFCEDARGRWYICISVKYESVAANGLGAVGIDLGLKTLATMSNGIKVENGTHYRRHERKIARLRQANKLRQARTAHAKIKNKRLDDLHKASTRIANENRVIVIGELQAAKLAKTIMGKSINDAGTSMFRTMLKYKASARQHWYVEVNEANTTRTCSACGVIPDSSPEGLKGLSVREWVCSSCGVAHDRDVNAAINILRLGYQTLAPEVA